jgi:hypothetical protein
MARETNKSSENGRGRLARMRGAITRSARKLTAKFRRGRGAETLEAQPQQREAASANPARAIGSPTRRRPQTDVPMDVITNAYTPTQTSLKGPFRANGDDRHRDQEMADGYSDDRWNDEDRITNKSGDPRIGTHRRSYEPGEDRAGRNQGGR